MEAHHLPRVIAARFVYPVDSPPIAEGAVAITDGHIVAVGSRVEIMARFPGVAVEDLGDALLTPAAINAHSHLELTALEGLMPRDVVLEEWITAVLPTRRGIAAEVMEGGAAQGVELVRASATAAVGDISATGLAVSPLVASGLRGVVYHELIAIDPNRAESALAAGQQQIAEWRERYPQNRVRFGLSLHTPYTVSGKLFTIAAAWCREEDIPLCIHCAESPAESELLMTGGGPFEALYRAAGWDMAKSWADPPRCSPVEWLERLDVLSARPLLAHGVQVDRADLGRIAAHDASVAHCPRSNAWLRCGRLPWDLYQSSGARLAMGTDSLASSPSLNVWDDAVNAWALHAQAGETPDPHALLRALTLSGAESLGFAAELGSLAPGKSAEFAQLASPDSLDGEEATSALARAFAEGWAAQGLRR